MPIYDPLGNVRSGGREEARAGNLPLSMCLPLAHRPAAPTRATVLNLSDLLACEHPATASGIARQWSSLHFQHSTCSV